MAVSTLTMILLFLGHMGRTRTHQYSDDQMQIDMPVIINSHNGCTCTYPQAHAEVLCGQPAGSPDADQQRVASSMIKSAAVRPPCNMKESAHVNVHRHACGNRRVV